jgi:hypothetical protein
MEKTMNKKNIKKIKDLEFKMRLDNNLKDFSIESEIYQYSKDKIVANLVVYRDSNCIKSDHFEKLQYMQDKYNLVIHSNGNCIQYPYRLFLNLA